MAYTLEQLSADIREALVAGKRAMCKLASKVLLDQEFIAKHLTAEQCRPRKVLYEGGSGAGLLRLRPCLRKRGARRAPLRTAPVGRFTAWAEPATRTTNVKDCSLRWVRRKSFDLWPRFYQLCSGHCTTTSGVPTHKLAMIGSLPSPQPSWSLVWQSGLGTTSLMF